MSQKDQIYLLSDHGLHENMQTGQMADVSPHN